MIVFCFATLWTSSSGGDLPGHLRFERPCNHRIDHRHRSSPGHLPWTWTRRQRSAPPWDLRHFRIRCSSIGSPRQSPPSTSRTGPLLSFPTLQLTTMPSRHWGSRPLSADMCTIIIFGESFSWEAPNQSKLLTILRRCYSLFGSWVIFRLNFFLFLIIFSGKDHHRPASLTISPLSLIQLFDSQKLNGEAFPGNPQTTNCSACYQYCLFAHRSPSGFASSYRILGWLTLFRRCCRAASGMCFQAPFSA